jgi:hypothetical protein
MTVVSFSMAYRSFRGGSGRLHTRLDTPPSINRRHPDSCLAHDGKVIRLMFYAQDGAGCGLELDPAHAMALAGRLIEAASTRLR